MATIVFILSIIAYIAAGAWTFGFIRAATNDPDGWETPIPIVSAVFWPIVLVGAILKNIAAPAAALGFSFEKRRLEKQKKRIELQEKVRVELKKIEQENAEAEKYLEEEWQALETHQRSKMKRSKIV